MGYNLSCPASPPKKYWFNNKFYLSNFIKIFLKNDSTNVVKLFSFIFLKMEKQVDCQLFWHYQLEFDLVFINIFHCICRHVSPGHHLTIFPHDIRNHSSKITCKRRETLWQFDVWLISFKNRSFLNL